MHLSSYENMKKALGIVNPCTGISVLDVGGRDKKQDRSYVKLFKEYADVYDVADIMPGPNVNITMPESYKIPVATNTYDIIVSGQTLEHVYNPFRLVSEMKRVLKEDGFMIIIVPSSGPRHDKVDCWRFLDDAFIGIAAECNLKIIENWIDRTLHGDRSDQWQDNVFIGQKLKHELYNRKK